MSYKVAMIPLLVAGLLASCNDNEEMIKNNPEFVEAGYGALSLTLKYPDGAKTKAVGDTLVGVAYEVEKTIKSVAFFVNTETETVNSVEQYGAFGGYFSDEDLLSANGLQEDLEEVTAGTPGEYMAKIRHRSDGWANPQVIVIANYLENGLAAKLKAVKNWKELGKVMSETIVENPKTPLLMYSIKTIEAWKRASGSNGGGAASADFDMDRLVARIDIHNNAYNQTTPGNGFVLTSARLICPKTASYLLPGITNLAAIPVSSELFPTSGKVEESGAAPDIIQKLDSLYAYENDNADPATATAVQVNGTFRGGLISKVIAFKKADGVGTTGDPIALARNHRYVVNLNAAPDSTDITWDIVVKEWSESDTIKVKPDYQKPDLATALSAGKVVFDAGTSGISYTSGKEIIITNAAAGDATLKFTTVGKTASVAKLAYGFDTDASSIGGKNDAIVERGDIFVTYGSAEVNTPFTINIPKQNDDEKVPLDIYVIICNSGNQNVRDTITIKSRPVYNGMANANPVLMKDGNYWAPVNVGATSTTNIAVAGGDNTATSGQVFQWGRPTGLPNTSTSINTNIAAVGRPVQADLADMSKWDGIFITSSTSSPNTRGNWLLINGAGNDNPASYSKDGWYQQLWNANEGVEGAPVKKGPTDPCPKGWRVPTHAEWIAIGSNLKDLTWTEANKNLTILGKESGKNLVLPTPGYRLGETAEFKWPGTHGEYWSSTVGNTDNTSRSIYLNDGNRDDGGKGNSGFSYGATRANGGLVRCIQD